MRSSESAGHAIALSASGNLGTNGANKDVLSEELEASYVLPEVLGKPEVYPYCDDWLELGRLYLEAGRLPHARRALGLRDSPRIAKLKKG